MSDDVLDLLARAQEPVMHLDPSRVISAGKRTRRRRRTLPLVAAGLATLAVAGSSLLADWAPRAHDVTPAGPPKAAAPTPSTPAPTPTDDTAAAAQTWGPVHVMSQQPDREGGRPALYLTPSRMLCIGTVDAQGDVTPSMCRHIKPPPPDAFGTGYSWSMNGNMPPGAAANEFVAGVVPADVTKVLVRTENGNVTAHLTQAPDPVLGQLYWAETRGPIAGSDEQAKDRSRVAYRGTKVAFTCSYFECVSK